MVVVEIIGGDADNDKAVVRRRGQNGGHRRNNQIEATRYKGAPMCPSTHMKVLNHFLYIQYGCGMQ